MQCTCSSQHAAQAQVAHEPRKVDRGGLGANLGADVRWRYDLRIGGSFAEKGERGKKIPQISTFHRLHRIQGGGLWVDLSGLTGVVWRKTRQRVRTQHGTLLGRQGSKRLRHLILRGATTIVSSTPAR